MPLPTPKPTVKRIPICRCSRATVSSLKSSSPRAHRAQVPNATFPKVSGDVIQCSPLIRAVAWLPESQVTGVNAAQLADPYFRWIGPDGLQVPLLDLYLVDTQPVVSRARYRYWLVRFNSFVEPIQTVPCGEVEIVDAANP